jgi:hypothetical protein
MSIPTVPGHTLTPMAAPAPLDVHNVKSTAQFHLREFLSAREKLRRGGSYELQSHLRNQAGLVLGNLSTLQAEVRALAKEAENHRWRRFLVGGAM